MAPTEAETWNSRAAQRNPWTTYGQSHRTWVLPTDRPVNQVMQKQDSSLLSPSSPPPEQELGFCRHLSALTGAGVLRSLAHGLGREDGCPRRQQGVEA